jgi:bifunctional non-homologous end joining protein LigD
MNREGFVVVGWTDPEGSRPWLGALLLACHDPAGRLVYAGRAGTGIKQAELERLWIPLASMPQRPLSLVCGPAPRQAHDPARFADARLP